MNLTPQKNNALKEVINIGVGRAAGLLNEMLGAHVQLQVSLIKIFEYKNFKIELSEILSDNLSIVRMPFQGSFSGTASLVFPCNSAAGLVCLLVGETAKDSDMDSIRTGALSEVGNIVLNGVMGSIGNIIEKQLNYSMPSYLEDTVLKLLSMNNPLPDSVVMLAHTHLIIERNMIEGDILLFFEDSSFDTLTDSISSAPEGSAF